MENNLPHQSNHFIVTHQSQSNGIGTAGFIVTILAIILCWIPILGQILWFLGLIFSFVGIFKKPKGLAIAGLVISLIGLMVFIIITVAFAGVLFVE